VSERERVEEIAVRDKRAIWLIGLAVFNTFVIAVGAISLFDAYGTKRRHARP
jgi:hypothetical protein